MEFILSITNVFLRMTVTLFVLSSFIIMVEMKYLGDGLEVRIRS